MASPRDTPRSGVTTWSPRTDRTGPSNSIGVRLSASFSNVNRLCIALGAVALLALGSASSASAATYCVSDSACEAGGGAHAASLQAALDAAQATKTESDTVK